MADSGPERPGRTSRAGPARTPTRRKARKRAIDIMFEADLRGTDVLATLAERSADADPPVREYTAELVRGVVADRAAIDARIAEHLAPDWSMDRLPRVDRMALRIAVFELSCGQVPANAVISEAVTLVGELSTDSSPSFVNGVLASVAGSHPTGDR